MPAVGCASRFAERNGIKLVEPVYDMVHFSDPIWEMKSNSMFEQRLADAMVDTWKNPVRPDFSETELTALEKGRAYESYVRLIADIIEDECASEGGSSALKFV
jgi:hypothetical protein